MQESVAHSTRLPPIRQAVMTGAMIAGFLLTALSNWTGIPAPSGLRLGVLFLLWLAGRLVLMTPQVWPVGLAIVLPGLFYVALAASATQDLLRAKNRRNLIMPVVLVLPGLAGLSWCLSFGAFL